IAISQQGQTVFAVWFTYDQDGSAMWLAATLHGEGDGWGTFLGYVGDLYRTSGARFDAFHPGDVVVTKVGGAVFSGVGDEYPLCSTPSFYYGLALDGVYSNGGRAIARQIFAAPGTSCQ